MNELIRLVDVRLDHAQRSVAELPPGRAVLVLGEAGHGKTTVALHRLAHLARTASGRFRAAVVVPAEGLRGLVERALVRLGVDAPAMTFDQFARAQARRAFPDLPRRESHDASAATIRLKRDPALGAAIDAIAARAPGVIDDDPDAEPVATPAHAVRGDLQHLFGDERLLARVVAGAARRLPAHAIAETLEHTHVQFGLTSEREWAHVDDAPRLIPVDRLALDDGTPNADAQTIDTEDYAVLFAIDRARARREGSRPTRPRPFDCLVIDEAQELAPLELALLGRSLRRGGSLVVAGDADQQLDEAAGFGGWEETMRRLRCKAYERATLDVSYRCPPEIVALARQALGDARAPRDALPFAPFASPTALASWLAERLDRMTDEDPRASIAVLCRAPLAARRIAERLREHLPVRLVWGGDFRFAPGVDVTTIDQVRGLEFDHVFVVDGAAYDADARSRRALYVAITRARTSVHLASAGARSFV